MVGWSKSSVLGSQVSGVEVLDGEATVFVLGGGGGGLDTMATLHA